MILENKLISSHDITVEKNTDGFYVRIFPVSSEYAFIASGQYGEKVPEIIKRPESIIPFSGDMFSKTDMIKIIDIYSDEEVFMAEISDEEKSDPEKEISEENASIIPSKDEREKTEDIPPKLITKKKTMKKTDISFMEKLTDFDSFDCRMPECRIKIFDEAFMKKEGVKVNYEGLSVPAWYPFLGYKDITALNSPMPQRLIGITKINDKEFLTYGVLTDLRRGIQPFFGSTGFVYLVTTDDRYGYWMMYLDINTGKVSYPYDEEYMTASEDIDFTA